MEGSCAIGEDFTRCSPQGAASSSSPTLPSQPSSISSASFSMCSGPTLSEYSNSSVNVTHQQLKLFECISSSSADATTVHWLGGLISSRGQCADQPVLCPLVFPSCILTNNEKPKCETQESDDGSCEAYSADSDVGRRANVPTHTTDVVVGLATLSIVMKLWK